jgi:hypothetical protein
MPEHQQRRSGQPPVAYADRPCEWWRLANRCARITVSPLRARLGVKARLQTRTRRARSRCVVAVVVVVRVAPSRFAHFKVGPNYRTPRDHVLPLRARCLVSAHVNALKSNADLYS